MDFAVSAAQSLFIILFFILDIFHKVFRLRVKALAEPVDDFGRNRFALGKLGKGRRRNFGYAHQVGLF